MADLDMTKRDNLLTHIEGLQAVLTKRNKEIETLKALLAGQGADERHQTALRREYNKGFKACAAQMMNASAEAARELGRFRKGAFDLYLQAERMEREEAGGGSVQLPADQEAVGGTGEGEGAEGPALGEGHRG